VNRIRKKKLVHFYDGLGIALDGLECIGHTAGHYGKIALFRHEQLGKVFVLNGEIQHVEAWAPLYHEPLVHLAAAFVPVVRNVLILGGGTLYAAAEALKYKSVERVVVIDQDEAIIRFTTKFYSHAERCQSDTRFKVLHEDAYNYLGTSGERFDIVINDGADLLKMSQQRGCNLLDTITKAISPSGVCSDVVYRHVFEKSQVANTIRRLAKKCKLCMSLLCIPEYHGSLHLLTIWGRGTSFVNQNLRRPLNLEQQMWIRQRHARCVLYNPRFLAFHLYLPVYLKRIIGLTKKAA
jgi:spermidine synthase